MEQATRIRHAVRRLMVNPWATFFFAMVLACDFVSLPDWQPWADSKAAWVRDGMRKDSSISAVGGGHRVFVERTDGGLRTHRPDDESWDRMIRVMTISPGEVMLVDYDRSYTERGLWGLTKGITTHALSIDRRSSIMGWTDGELAAAREAAVNHLVQERFLPEGLGQTLLREDSREVRVLWNGWAHNVFAAMSFVGLVASLGWVPGARRHWTARRLRNAALHRRCHRCGYHLAGSPGGTCPECGVIS